MITWSQSVGVSHTHIISQELRQRSKSHVNLSCLPPGKFYTEPENHVIEKGKRLPTFIFGFHVHFQGCTFSGICEVSRAIG